MILDNVKKYAKLRGLSLRQLALKTGLSENAIYAWDKKKPTIPTLKAVAQTLNISYEELTGEQERNDSKQTTVDLKAVVDDDDFFLTYQGKELSVADKELIKRLFEGKE